MRSLFESKRPQRNGAPRSQVLMTASTAAEGPWCFVTLVKEIEVLYAEKNCHVIIEVKDPVRDSEPVNYSIHGATSKSVNIPQGIVRVKRLTGKLPITVFAHCGV